MATYAVQHSFLGKISSSDMMVILHTFQTDYKFTIMGNIFSLGKWGEGLLNGEMVMLAWIELPWEYVPPSLICLLMTPPPLEVTTSSTLSCPCTTVQFSMRDAINECTPNDITSNEGTTNEHASNEHATNKCTTNKQVTSSGASNKHASNKCASNECTYNELTFNELTANRCLCEEEQ